MEYRINCFNCNAVHALPIERIDKRFTCSKCQTVMIVRLAEAPVSASNRREPESLATAKTVITHSADDKQAVMEAALSNLSIHSDRLKTSGEQERNSRRGEEASIRREPFSLLLAGIIAASISFAVLGCLLVFVSDSAAIAVMGFAMLLGGLVCMASNLWLAVISFQAHVKSGLLFLFLPLYPLYFVCTRWVLCRRPILLASSGAISILAGLAIIGVHSVALPVHTENEVVASANIPEPGVRNAPSVPRDTFKLIRKAAPPREVKKVSPPPPLVKTLVTPCCV